MRVARVIRRAALGLSLIAIAGCGGSNQVPATESIPAAVASAAKSKPLLVVHLAVGSHVVRTSTTTIHGTATRGASVRVNGKFVQLHHGSWRRTLRLHLGSNRISVETTMRGRAPVFKSIRITRRRSAAELEARAIARREAEARPTAEREAEAGRQEPESGASCSNGTYVNAAGNTVCKPEESPTVPAGATARCEDGTYSFSESRSGTCSHHGGVAEWLSG
jgi:Protein of unknown function (DUF3761)/Glucodextranase, domain B